MNTTCYLLRRPTLLLLLLLSTFSLIVRAESSSPSLQQPQPQQQHSILDDHHPMPTEPPLVDKVCIIGSGNWGSAIATLVGRNCQRWPMFETRVKMWVYEEMVDLPAVAAANGGGDGTKTTTRSKLTEIINTRHENVKYLPGIILPDNIVAVADLAEACHDATLLIFVLPHQFLPRLLPTIRASAHPSCRGVSLIKGLGMLLLLLLSLLCRETIF
jgi:glycerol-3-phosphate dehydrogenase (NAD+)